MEIDLEKSKWQALMNSAYKRWNDPNDLGGVSQKEMLNTVSVKERYAVLLGNLNYQVNNGGFSQWVDNQYAKFGYDVIDALRVIVRNTTGETLTIILELMTRLEKLLGYIRYPDNGDSFNYWLPSDDDDDDLSDGFSGGEKYANSLDDWYYKVVSSVLLPAVEEFLNKD